MPTKTFEITTAKGAHIVIEATFDGIEVYKDGERWCRNPRFVRNDPTYGPHFDCRPYKVLVPADRVQEAAAIIEEDQRLMDKLNRTYKLTADEESEALAERMYNPKGDLYG